MVILASTAGLVQHDQRYYERVSGSHEAPYLGLRLEFMGGDEVKEAAWQITRVG